MPTSRRGSRTGTHAARSRAPCTRWSRGGCCGGSSRGLRSNRHGRPCAGTYAADGGLRAHLAALEELEAFGDATGDGAASRTGGSFVFDRFWSAWDAFAGAADYRDAIERAVRYGHDTDTTAAIAGGLAGIRFGWDAIPADWRRGMRGREIVTPLVDRLVETSGARTSSSQPARGRPAGPVRAGPPGGCPRGHHVPARQEARRLLAGRTGATSTPTRSRCGC